MTISKPHQLDHKISGIMDEGFEILLILNLPFKRVKRLVLYFSLMKLMTKILDLGTFTLCVNEGLTSRTNRSSFVQRLFQFNTGELKGLD